MSAPGDACFHATQMMVKTSIAHAVKTGASPRELYESILGWAVDIPVEQSLLDGVKAAADAPPEDYVHQQGWVLIAFQNALWQLLHAPNFEEGVADTVMHGGVSSCCCLL